MPSLAHEALATLMHLTVHRRMPHDDEGMLAELTAAQLRPRSFSPPRSLDRHVSLRVGVRHGWRTYEMAPWGPRLPAHRVVYFHGGGYVGEIDPNHWSVCRRIATLTPARVVVPIYPVAPGTTAEVTVPTAAAIAADVIADAILGGGDASLVTLMGDSAGGGLALAVAQALRDEQIAAPRLVLIAPWVDATMTHSDIDVVGARDPMLSIPRLTRAGELYAGHLAVSDPRVSPINGSMTGLGPMTIFAGTRDLLLPDARRLRDAAREAGVAVEYHEGEGLIHVFPILPLPEARQARRAIVGAIRWPG
ncbi:MAG: alpha/beta hydrolase [Candidatus Phosphoribacter sp.]|nr:alpha/beta hydrolase [Actinomycetales bacterium]